MLLIALVFRQRSCRHWNSVASGTRKERKEGREREIYWEIIGPSRRYDVNVIAYWIEL